MSGTRVPLQDGTFAFFPEGTSEADMAAAMQQLTLETPKPPPGVIIHEPNRSYVTGAQGEPTLSVDTAGMQPGTMSKTPGFNLSDFITSTAGSLAGGGGGNADPRLPDRNTAAAALAMRRDSTPFSIAARPAPFVQGLSAGYGDEALSAAAGAGQALRGGSFGDMYGTMQEAQRQELAQDRAEYPAASTALQAGGALANLSALAKLGVPLGAPEGSSMLTRMLAGGGLGGLMGGVEGFGSGSGLADRLQQAKQGGLLGAGIGAAIPPVASGAGNLITRGLDWLGVRPYLEQLGVGRPAATAVNRVLEGDDAYAGAGARNIAQAGPGAMMADAGPGSTGLLDTALQKGGAGSRIVREMVDRRAEQANQNLTTAFDTALGTPRGLQTMQAEIRQTGQPVRHSAYETAYNTPIDYSASEATRLQELLGRLNGEGGQPDAVVREANRLMRIKGEPPSAQIRATIADDGTISFDRLPDVRQIDYITRGLRKVAQNEETAGIMGGPSDIGAAYRDLAGDIRGTTRTLVPAYGNALDTAADDIGRIEAIKAGNNLLSPSVTRDDAVQILRRHNTSAAEMDNVRLGVRQKIFDDMDRVTRIATDPNVDARQAAAELKVLSSDAANAKLDMVIPDPLQRQQLATQIEQATAAIQLRANVVQNSKTFGRGVYDEVNKAMLEPGPAGQMLRGHPFVSGQRATQMFTGRTPEYDIGRSDVMNRQIAELLTAANPQRQLGLLREAFTRSPQNAATGQEWGGFLGLLGGVPGYTAARDYFRGK
jgi:hypothetical protein